MFVRIDNFICKCVKYSAMDIADYVVKRCAEQRQPVSNLQLQKILYYIQLNFFLMFDKCAFSDEIQAWRHGPVVKEVYYKYNIFGRHKIIPHVKHSKSNLFLTKHRNLIDRVTDTCMQLNSYQLADRACKTGGPWHQSFTGSLNTVIPKEIMRTYVRNH